MKTEQISYADLAKRVGDCILFNNHNVYNDEWYQTLLVTPLIEKRLAGFDRDNGISDDDEDAERSNVLDIEIYQTYHITAYGAQYLINYTSELVSYDEILDAWLWHISHFGTAWSGVYTTVYDFSDENDRDIIDTSNDDYKRYTFM